MFNEGDLVRIKPDTEVEFGVIADDWAGEIKWVFPGEGCLVALDAYSLDSIENDFLAACLLNDLYPDVLFFDFDALVPTLKRRDTSEQRELALDALEARIESVEKILADLKKMQFERWAKDFKSSQHFEKLSAIEQEESTFVAMTFLEMMRDYVEESIFECSPKNIREVCLEIIPTSVVAEAEEFKKFGDILQHFLAFMGEENHIANVEPLIRTLERIKHKIARRAANSNNWSVGKALMMKAKKEGVDITDDEEIEKYMYSQSSVRLGRKEEFPFGAPSPTKREALKNIGRNQRITVKYSDGRIVENIKFKKVEDDVRSGDCEILEL